MQSVVVHACNPKESCPGYLRDPHFITEKKERLKTLIAIERSPRQHQNELPGLKALELPFHTVQGNRGVWGSQSCLAQVETFGQAEHSTWDERMKDHTNSRGDPCPSLGPVQ